MSRLISYYRARYYSPQIGRFISRDPLGFMLMMDFGSSASGLSMNELIPYYRARYLSPAINRFISRDPLQGAEMTQGPNLYWYVHNNPANALDPKGLSILNEAIDKAKDEVSELYAQAAQAKLDAINDCPIDFPQKKCCLKCVSDRFPMALEVVRQENIIAFSLCVAAIAKFGGGGIGTLAAALAAEFLCGGIVESAEQDELDAIQHTTLRTAQLCNLLN